VELYQLLAAPPGAFDRLWRQVMQAGEYRHRVSLQNTAEVSDGHDGLTESLTTVMARVPARVRPLAGRDLERAQQIDKRISHEVTLRYWRTYRTELDGGRARLIYHDTIDRTLHVVGAPIDVDERHEDLTVLCREAA
jgi:SPP1 family predicted phage head-tail adaptor